MVKCVVDIDETVGSIPTEPTDMDKIEVLYEDKDSIVIDKPAGIDVITLGEELSKLRPELNEVERKGIVHRLDKDTSGLLVLAKTGEALIFFQKQFKTRSVVKSYIALATGRFKEEEGTINVPIGRSPKDGKKQRAYLPFEPGPSSRREAVTEYKVIQEYENYTLLEVHPKTGRKHQIRCHLAYIGHPIVGDKVYGFKNQPCPDNLKRHFLHASYIKLKFPDGKYREFKSELPEELKICLPKQ